MRHFLYLDHDLVDSIIAQEHKGLVTGLSENREKQFEETSAEMIGANINTELNLGLASLLSGKINANVEGSKEKGEGIISTDSKVVTKILHDAAFEIAFNAISPKAVTDTESIETHGEYVLLRRVFTIVDFDELEALLGENGLLDFKKSLDQAELEKEMNNKISELSTKLSKDKLKSVNSRMRHELDQAIKANYKQYDDIAQSVRLLRKIVPYDRMLVSYDGYIIPMDDQYFRTNAKNMAFKYGGELNCVGLITNIVSNNTESNAENIFTTLQDNINSALVNMLPIKGKRIYILQPIAIYYE